MDGKVELTPSQVQAASFLIGMAIAKPPQEQTVTHDGELVIRWKS